MGRETEEAETKDATNDVGDSSARRHGGGGWARHNFVEEGATKVVGDSSDGRHAASKYARKMPAQKVAVECAEETTKVVGDSSARRHAASHLRLKKVDWPRENCWLER